MAAAAAMFALFVVLISSHLGLGKKLASTGSPQILSFTSIVEPPFLSINREVYGETSYVGFIPDLIQKVARRLKVPYKIHMVKDGAYGIPDHDGSWNGMIGEVVRGKASVAAGALSIRPAREEVVDFTEPFMTVGIKAVFKRPNPGETLPISSVRDLANQTNIQYGVIAGSMTMWFFRASRDPTLYRMWENMESWRNVGLVRSSWDGIERVRKSNGSYVFLLESIFADYLVNHPPCDLLTLEEPELLNPNKYAFAVQKGSALKHKISRAIRGLKRKGEIERLYNKWWKTDCIAPTPKPKEVRTPLFQKPQPRSGLAKTPRTKNTGGSASSRVHSANDGAASHQSCDIILVTIVPLYKLCLWLEYLL